MRQNIIVSSGKLENEKKYWLDKLNGDITMGAFPADMRKERPEQAARQVFSSRVPDELFNRLNRMSGSSMHGMYLILLTCTAYLLSRYTGVEDIVLGMPPSIEGGQEGQSNGLLPLRVQVEANLTFKDLLLQVRSSAIEAERNCNFPIGRLAGLLNLPVDEDGQLQFNTAVLINGIHGRRSASALKAGIVFAFGMEDDYLTSEIEYFSSLYYKETAEQILSHLVNILRAVLDNPGIMLNDVEILSEEEKTKILCGFNATKAGYPENKTIHRLFEEQVERTPENTAVVFENKQLTYRELNEKANRMARVLRARGLGPDYIVAIALERSLEMIIGILAVLKAGGAYLPIDPEYPQERIAYMLENSGAGMLLTQENKMQGITFQGTIIDIGEERLEISGTENLENLNAANHLAYIIYTSGTTGKPKGTMIEHENVVRLMFNDKMQFDFNDKDVWTLFHSYCFDFSVWEMYGALLYGGKLIVVPKLKAQNSREFLKLLEEEKVTVLNQTPTAFYSLVQEEQGNSKSELGIRYVIFGGEALQPVMLKGWRKRYPKTKLVNMYGITETTVHVTYKEITENEIERNISNIGKPIPTLTAYILDKNMRLLPIGAAGELYVGGKGVGRGYLNNSVLTAQKFTQNPYNPTERLYKSGDLARFLPEGDMEYLGRIDHQVKIRGFRIELGEIESRLLGHPRIKETVVLAKDDPQGGRYLAAYFVGEDRLTASQLREHLAKDLPDYMIPAYFVQIEKMPLSPNGKIDRKALPDCAGISDLEEEYTAPVDAVEEKLVEIWKDILGKDGIGTNHDFFHIGGHSLKAAILISRIHMAFNIAVPFSEVFRTPTIKDIAGYIRTADKSMYSSIRRVEDREYYPVSPAQKRLYLLNQIEGGGTSYNMPGVITVEGSLDRTRLENAFNSLIKRHEILRTSFEMAEGEPVQRVHGEVKFKVDYTEGNDNNIDEIIKGFIRPFDLDKVPLLRVGLVKIEADRHVMLFDMHHIISDGTSMDVLVREFTQLYGGHKLSGFRLQYRDYSAWQNELFRTGGLKGQEEYWLEKYRDEVPVLNMPTDYARPSEQSFEGDSISFEVGEEIVRELNSLAKETGTTMYMVLLGAYNALLQRYTGQEDIVVGSPIAGRPHADLQNMLGMFVNTLAMRNHPKGEKSFKEFLTEVKENSLKAYENQEYQFEELVERLNIRRDMSRNPLFDTMFALQNTGNMRLEIEGLKFIPYGIENKIAKFDITLNALEQGGKLFFDLEYCTRLFKKETVESLAKHFINILGSIVNNPDTMLSGLNMLSEEEKEEILYRFNDTKAEYPKEKTIHELFEEQVERTPDNIAVVYEDKQLTYWELNEMANSLAVVLREKGVKPDTIVGIMVERSLEMIVGILGILKAGGAYLPIDPEYPEDRIKYMLEDSGVKLVLIQKKNTLDLPAKKIYIDDEAMCESSSEYTSLKVNPESLAYAIYTSGTTGKPKGVMVTSRNLVHYVYAFFDEFDVEEEDAVLSQASYCFDAFVEEVYPVLVKGGSLVIAAREDVFDIGKFAQIIEENKISIISCSPMLLNELNQLPKNKLETVRIFISGGDELKKGHISNLLKNSVVYNTYGPTEATVCVTYYKCTGKEENTIPIGKSIKNTRVLIIDKNKKLLPVGVAGELCIAGDGLARGYLNRPELTTEKFVENPFVAGERMYRTGDLARWLPDGNIEFLGRIDDQVKIRGFRIELGEIESQLLKYDQIKEAVVIAKEDKAGDKYLCAYYVSEIEIPVTEIRGYLSRELPDYMIPSYFIHLDRMPLTPNGKVDRKALPEPEGSINTGVEYVAPTNEIEEKMVKVWQEVLRLDKIGINDNFFELGGDSIKAIQVSSRLHKYGLKIEIRDLMKKPTICELAAAIKNKEDNKADQGVVEGRANLTAIQKWFFDKNFTGKHHWNQAVMIKGKNEFKEDILRKVFRKIVEHHDALRMVYRVEQEEVEQYNRKLDEGELFTLETIDLTCDSNYELRIKEECSRIQSGIDLSAGPLVKLGLFKTVEGDHLLIAIHHLAVDGVSWRIIFEDYATGYEQAVNNNKIVFQDKTHSFRDWASKVEEYGKSSKLLWEREYWKNILSKNFGHVKVDNSIKGKGRIKDCHAANIILSEEYTIKLTRQANRAYNTEINDILLTALGLALRKWSGLEAVAINLEGHGRENIIKDVDISRTVGWFTAAYPVMLEMNEEGNIGYSIKSVKENLRKIPNKGVGYGILKYISGLEDVQDIDFEKEPEISFNYLGNFGQDMDTEVFGVSRFSTGQSIHPEAEASYKVDINGMIAGDKLIVDFRYNGSEYRDETISSLANIYKEKLVEVIEHCISKGKVEFTPSDYGDTGLGLGELESIVEIHGENIQYIYPLTPMQEGMLFHALEDNKSQAYFEQLSYGVKGEIDVAAVQNSIGMLIKRYDILRTSIVHTSIEIPRQVVLKERHVSICFEDISYTTGNEKQEYIKNFEKSDREKGFDLTKDSLIRVSLLKTGECDYQFVWSFHHIVVDGWCMPIIFGEFLECYTALCKGESVEWEEATPYREYIYWLGQQDREIAMKYWSEYLAGYGEKAVIPGKSVKGTRGEYIQATVNYMLDEEMTGKLTAIAKEQQVTLNSMFQAIWGVMLQKYNNAKDVVFGTIVSGRPVEVAGIEKMVGLFINAIPVRVECGEDISFGELLKKVHENAITSEKYSFCPLVEVQELSGLKNELIDHLVVFENYPMEQIQKEKGKGAEVMEIDYDSTKAFEQTNYDMNVTIIPGNQLTLRITYNSLAYDGQIIGAIGLHFNEIAQNIISDPNTKMSKLEMLSEEEKEEILYRFNDTKAEYPKEKTIHELFEEQVERTPDNIAVVYEDRQLTYRELNERANSLAV
ncbi:MAG: amino acid adenylation domain-containing protein, partial [Bacillota bacterium]|nr:amino acid adenylation domain-containing protein [Bacillota bacterium]